MTPVQHGLQAAGSSRELTTDTSGTFFTAPLPPSRNAWNAPSLHVAAGPPAEAPAHRADSLLEDLWSQDLDTISTPDDAIGKLVGDMDALDDERFIQMLLEAP